MREEGKAERSGNEEREGRRKRKNRPQGQDVRPLGSSWLE